MFLWTMLGDLKEHSGQILTSELIKTYLIAMSLGFLISVELCCHISLLKRKARLQWLLLSVEKLELHALPVTMLQNMHCMWVIVLVLYIAYNIHCLSQLFNFKGYFETLRAEHSCQGISVTMLCPGPVFSELLDACVTDTYGQVPCSLVIW